MAYLVLVRHGRSEYNDKGLWTGFTDIALNEEGKSEAHRTSEAIKDIKFNNAFTSLLIRAQETLDIILKDLEQDSIPVEKDFALNERDYGDYTGKNKWQVKEEIGEEEFQKLRRSFDYPIPNGESLKMVYERVVPHFEQQILPLLKEDKNVLISAHGNSLRALVKYLENLSNEEVANLEIRTGEAYVYQVDNEGKIASKEIRAQNEKAV